MYRHNELQNAARRAVCATMILLTSAIVAQAAVYTVTGTVRTPTGGNPLANNANCRYIRVIVMDEDVWFDDHVGTVYADGAGDFSNTFADNWESPDVYINVEYVGEAVDGRYIEVRLAHTDANPIYDTNISGVSADIAVGATNLGVMRVSTTRANIISQVGDAVRNLNNSYGTWAMPANINAEGRTTNGASYVAANGSHMSISMEDYNSPGAGNAAFSDIHHETFHWVAYRAYGNRWPNFNCNANPHNSRTESCEGFAMQEGSAQYFGSSSAVADQKTNAPIATAWRGTDNTGTDNTGEIVEGALELAWRGIADLSGSLQVFLTDSPDSMKEFVDGYITDKGATAAASQTLLTQCATNGMVFTRGRLNGFTPGAPPNASPPSAGNFKVIDDRSFVRGTPTLTVAQLTAAQLMLGPGSAIIAADQKDVGFKVAVDGDTENDVTTFTYVGPVLFANDLNWNTTVRLDGDYDLLIRLRNVNAWNDTFNPDFMGDSNAARDWNEEWLKFLQTWYSRDGEPNNNHTGKVIIDNTAPTVTGFGPQ